MLPYRIRHTYMFQITKQILILVKDKQSKYKIQFLNDYLIYRGGGSYLNYLALCEKVIAS